MNRHACWPLVTLLAACAAPPPDDDAVPDPPAGFEPPVIINAETPVVYPSELYDQQIQGTVLLYLFVDEEGNLVTDSTRIAEGSGHPGLDSAALRGVTALEFAPARRDGIAVAAAFLQPINFEHPDLARGSGENQ